MISAAIVGLGWWGRVMVRAARDHADRIRFTHGVERSAAAAKDFAANNNLHLLGSLDAALQDPAIDAVVLATPHSLHVDQIVACARAGKPVFSEKPLALTLADGRRAIEACRDAGVVLGLGTDRRILPAMRALKDIIATGRLGRLLHVEAQYSNDTLSRGMSGGWRQDPAETPGAGMTGPGLHALDGLVDLAGPVVRLSGQIYRPQGAATPIDTASLLLTFHSGATGLLGCVRGVPEYVRMSVFGTSGWAEMLGWGRLRLSLAGQAERSEDVDPSFAVGHLLARFADAVEGKAPFPVSQASMLNTVAAFEAAIAAFESGGPRDVPGPF